VLEEGRSEIGQKMDQALREQQKLERQIADRLEALDRQAAELFDFTLGTHPISTKGTTEIGGAKRRSDFDFYTGGRPRSGARSWNHTSVIRSLCLPKFSAHRCVVDS
jgi:hypothetical protein